MKHIHSLYLLSYYKSQSLSAKLSREEQNVKDKKKTLQQKKVTTISLKGYDKKNVMRHNKALYILMYIMYIYILFSFISFTHLHERCVSNSENNDRIFSSECNFT